MPGVASDAAGAPSPPTGKRASGGARRRPVRALTWYGAANDLGHISPVGSRMVDASAGSTAWARPRARGRGGAAGRERSGQRGGLRGGGRPLGPRAVPPLYAFSNPANERHQVAVTDFKVENLDTFRTPRPSRASAPATLLFRRR